MNNQKTNKAVEILNENNHKLMVKEVRNALILIIGGPAILIALIIIGMSNGSIALKDIMTVNLIVVGSLFGYIAYLVYKYKYLQKKNSAKIINLLTQNPGSIVWAYLNVTEIVRYNMVKSAKRKEGKLIMVNNERQIFSFTIFPQFVDPFFAELKKLNPKIDFGFDYDKKEKYLRN